MTRTLRLLSLLLCLVPLGLLGRRAPGFAGELLGNIAYVTFFSGLFALVFPRGRAPRYALAAFVFTCLIELSQASSHPILVALRKDRLARIVLGSTYTPLDFLWYTLSVPVAGILVQWVLRSATKPEAGKIAP